MSRPDALSEVELLHLVDRAENGTLLAAEAVLLRDGIRSLCAARRSLGGLQAKQQRGRRDAQAANRAAVLPPWTADGPMIAPCAPRCDDCTTCR